MTQHTLLYHLRELLLPELSEAERFHLQSILQDLNPLIEPALHESLFALYLVALRHGLVDAGDAG